MKKKVVAIAVVAVLLVSAVAVAVYTVQKSRHNILDGCYADVSDAEYMAACLSNGFSASSTAESMRDYYMDSYDTCSLYKIDHEGNYSPIKFYKERFGFNTEVKYGHDLIYMKKIGSLLYVIYTPDARSHKYGPGSVTDPEQYVISLENGRVYAVPDCNHICVRNNEYGINIAVPIFDYIGDYEGKPLFLKSKRGDNVNTESVSTMEISGGKLVIKEVFKIDRMGTYAKVYKNDIIVMSQNPIGYGNGQSGPPSLFARFPNGSVYTQNIEICDGYVCKSVNRLAGYFPLSCERFNADGTTTHVEFTPEESFRIASEDTYSNVIYRYDSGDDRVLVRLTGQNQMTKVTLDKSLNHSEEVLNFGHNIVANSLPFNTDHELWAVAEDKRLYTFYMDSYRYYSGFKESTVIDGKTVMCFENGLIRTYDMETGDEGTIDMPDVAILSSINVVNGKVYVSGISQSGQVSTVKVNPDGTAESSLSEMELRTYIMLPIA